MKAMNKQINLPQINKIMMNFEKESELMDIKEEMMNDAIDNVMEEEDDEEESENIVNQIFDEIGISLNQEVSITFLLLFTQLKNLKDIKFEIIKKNINTNKNII